MKSFPFEINMTPECKTCVFCPSEPDFPYLEALAPYQPLAMKNIHCPIDTSLNFNQANKLIRELKPSTLVVPECYTHPPPAFPQRTELVIDQVKSILGLFHTRLS